MENYVSAQLLLLGQAALLGMLGGVVYDLLRPLRRGRLIHLTDALFTGGGLVLMVWFLTAVSRARHGSFCCWEPAAERGCIFCCWRRCCGRCGTFGPPLPPPLDGCWHFRCTLV